MELKPCPFCGSEKLRVVGKKKVIGSTGQKKIEAHPMAAQLPKYNDTANKTLGVMLDLIAKLGTAAPAGDKLGEFLSE